MLCCIRLFYIAWFGLVRLGECLAEHRVETDDSQGIGPRDDIKPVVRMLPFATASRNAARARRQNINNLTSPLVTASRNAVVRSRAQVFVDSEGSISKLPARTVVRTRANAMNDSVARGSEALVKPVASKTVVRSRVRTLVHGLRASVGTQAGDQASNMSDLPSRGSDTAAKRVVRTLAQEVPTESTVSPPHRRTPSLRADDIITYACLLGTLIGLVAFFVIRWDVVASLVDYVWGGTSYEKRMKAFRRKSVRTEYYARNTFGARPPPRTSVRRKDLDDATADVRRSVSDSRLSLMNGVVSLKENAVFTRKMWKLNQHGDPTDMQEWRERIVWISSSSHLYYCNDLNSRDQQFFDQSTRDLRITELSSESSCFQHAIRLEAGDKEVILATDSKQVMVTFLDSCQGDI